MSQPMELIDFGDATAETRQDMPVPMYLDSVITFGSLPG